LCPPISPVIARHTAHSERINPFPTVGAIHESPAHRTSVPTVGAIHESPAHRTIVRHRRGGYHPPANPPPATVGVGALDDPLCRTQSLPFRRGVCPLGRQRGLKPSPGGKVAFARNEQMTDEECGQQPSTLLQPSCLLPYLFYRRSSPVFCSAKSALSPGEGIVQNPVGNAFMRTAPPRSALGTDKSIHPRRGDSRIARLLHHRSPS